MRSLASVVLVWCATLSAAQDMPSEAVRQNAEQVAASVVRAGWPKVDDGPVANCVRDHATAAELIYLGSGDPAAVDDVRKAAVLSMLAGPETRACVKSNGVVFDLGKEP